MKIIISKELLMEGINIVQKAVSTKNNVSLLDGILLEADEIFKMTGNDSEIRIECIVSADIRKKGSIVINSKMFGDIIRRMPESEIMIELIENNDVLIECENSHFKIKGNPSDDYPGLPEIEAEKSFKISQKIARDMIRETIFAVGEDENREILTGSLIESNENELTFVSIDGYRMALRRKTDDMQNTNFKVVVPGKTLNEISKILQPEDGEVEIFSSKNQILFKFNNCMVMSRLLEGEYLNYKSIVPDEYETKIRVNTKELLYSIERASLMSSDGRKYPVKFVIEDDNLIILSNTETGNVREEITTEMEGKNMSIGFNPRYFVESLRVIEDETVDMYFNSEVGPCTIKPIETDEFAYMILPVRINN
ncbi:DNA polymerase III subunit beta [Herbivorax sp. ANBcel31]|uniref:DNA polymerase III subunit beta n=1 Tax=Herbivorax sp. ANBcel31 TaxID=3069754 RepID=UPI0027B82687|nr:DNA polymerase III subunit beta [Herbivorax sp. ANBcel31]MDQ2086017.1 DNA polymerase III subunit beta [Herbivorax sp. ANBcel31]